MGRKNTAHIMLISNFKSTPMIYLVQEKNKYWGIFGGGQEDFDQSLTYTAIRELYEETFGSLIGNPKYFRHLDSYSIVDQNGNIHKTFIIIDSSFRPAQIKIDLSKNAEIINGIYLPLYLVLSCIYNHQYCIIYKNQKYTLRYFFAEGIRRNKDYLYTIFNKKYLTYTENRNQDLDIKPIILSQKKTTINQS